MEQADSCWCDDQEERCGWCWLGVLAEAAEAADEPRDAVVESLS